MAEGEHLHAVVHDGDGPYALLLHGLLGSRSFWLDNIETLQAVCRPVVVELWGHGRSPAPADPARYEPEGYAEELERLRVELGAERWFAIGQSLGSGLVLHYGLAHPERVLAHVVTNSLSAFVPTEGWRERAARTAEPQAERVRRDGVLSLRDEPINPGRSRRLSARVREALASELEEHTAGAVAYAMTVTTAGAPLGERLRDVSAPTLLTVGRQEERFLPLVDRVRLIPNLEVVELDAGHPVNAHDPAGWNAAVTRFLAAHADGLPSGPAS